jgi:ribonucleoside-diphosphate reductase alpha chain
MENKYRWLTPESQTFLERDYLLTGQTLDQRVDIICAEAERRLGIKDFAKKFKENIQKGWYSLSTPVWTNYATNRGLPISCFGSYVDDNMESILHNIAEVGMMTKMGGGTSAYFGKLRPRGSEIKDNGQSAGSVHQMQLFDKLITVVSQGKTRRGNFAAYLDIDHEDIMEFLTIRGEGSPIQDLSFGVCVPSQWLKEMKEGDAQKRKVWAKVLQIRAEFGYPYIQFTDNANNNTVDVYKDKNKKIYASNLCSEIMLPSNNEESFVCCLSSMNLLHFDEWYETDAVKMMVYFLDTVMEEFIEKASKIKFMERAVNFAKNHRALGLGRLGWHSYLQSKMIPFESLEAKLYNVKIAKFIKEQSYEASAELAQMFGEPEMLKGYGRRNTTLNADAPTKSSAFILGQVSESNEPAKANYYIKDLAKIKFTVKNTHLEALLIEKEKNTQEVWNSILMNAGSVQHLEFLSDHEKLVFKTFAEISQREVIIQASQRQKYIDQGQSLNLMVHPSIPTKDVNSLMLEAEELGIKALYYQYSVNAAQAFTRDILNCVSCEA